VAAEDAAVFEDRGFAVLDGDGLDHAFMQALVAVVALDVFGKQIRGHEGSLFLDEGIDVSHEKIFDVLAVDVVEQHVAVSQFLHGRILQPFRLDGHALCAETQAETGPEFHQVLDIAFLDDVLQGFDDIVGPFQMAGTADTDFQYHGGIVFRIKVQN
jgi:hypothetical protein